MSSGNCYPWLPAELYSKIFNELPVEDESAVILTRAMQANRLLHRAIKDLAIWQSLYWTRYTHHDVRREKDRARQFGGELVLALRDPAGNR